MLLVRQHISEERKNQEERCRIIIEQPAAAHSKNIYISIILRLSHVSSCESSSREANQHESKKSRHTADGDNIFIVAKNKLKSPDNYLNSKYNFTQILAQKKSAGYPLIFFLVFKYKFLNSPNPAPTSSSQYFNFIENVCLNWME